MGFKNVYLTEDEQEYWATYFTNMCPERSGYVSNRNRWQALTINKEKTIFVKYVESNRDEPSEQTFLFFWNKHLFRVEMRHAWGDEVIEQWDVLRFSDYFKRADGISISKDLLSQKNEIFTNLKEAMSIYGEIGVPAVDINPPIPFLRISVEGVFYN